MLVSRREMDDYLTGRPVNLTPAAGRSKFVDGPTLSDHEPIDGHPGFYRRNGVVCFRIRDRRGRRVWHSAPTSRRPSA